MKIIKVSSQDIVRQAVKILKAGGVIVYPTETAYGLGCDAADKRAVEKIYQIKGRSYKNPLPMIAASLVMAQGYANFSDKALRLASKYWPGPLTLVLPAKRKPAHLRLALLPRQKTIALRVSSSELARQLSVKLGRPIMSTSANISGHPSCYNVSEVKKQLSNHDGLIDLVIDGGKLVHKLTSTIVQVTSKQIEILRQGEIKLS